MLEKCSVFSRNLASIQPRTILEKSIRSRALTGHSFFYRAAFREAEAFLQNRLTDITNELEATRGACASLRDDARDGLFIQVRLFSLLPNELGDHTP